MEQHIWLARLLWYGVGIYLALSYIQGPVFKAWKDHSDFPKWVNFVRVCLVLVLIVAFFVLVQPWESFTMAGWALGLLLALLVLIHVAVDYSKTQSDTNAQADAQKGMAFPATVTVVVGIWLVILAAICVAGLFFAFNASCWPEWLSKCIDHDYKTGVSYPGITMFGAGVGSTIATILGYLEHASQKKDFERAYAPWYVGRPVMGLLLGLVFYFLLRGGLLVVSTNNSGELNTAGLAGVGGLVGLFSKQAIEKLQEVFDTLFSTKKDQPPKSDPPKSDPPKIGPAGNPPTGNQPGESGELGRKA